LAWGTAHGARLNRPTIIGVPTGMSCRIPQRETGSRWGTSVFGDLWRVDRMRV